MARKNIQKLIEELRSWLPNYDSGPDSFPHTLYRILASLPGGDELEDMGYEPMPGIGWKEADLLGQVLTAIQDKSDVEDLVAGLIHEEGEEVGEVRSPTQSAYRGGRHGARFRIDLDEHCALTEQALGRPMTADERIICKRAWEEGRSPEFAANTIRRAMHETPMRPLRERPYPSRPTRALPPRRRS